MTSTTLTISSDYGYVILAAASTFIVNAIHSSNTGRYRKAAKVPYPECYATTEQNKTSPAHLAFSCAQRAHVNYLENQPTTIAAMLIAGLQFPRIAAGLGLFWSINRYIYMVGYSKEGPKGRNKGLGYVLAQVGLIGMSIFSGLLVAGWV